MFLTWDARAFRTYVDGYDGRVHCRTGSAADTVAAKGLIRPRDREGGVPSEEGAPYLNSK